MRGLFVTGTDTGVGKTVLSAALMTHAPNARYWKPVQTGIEEDDDTAEVARLCGRDTARSGYRLPNPVSPHLAAKRAGIRIDLASFTPEEGVWVVEGAGGVLVPLNDSDTMASLMQQLGLPVLVAARSTLGTINHTLLTLEALRARSLEAAGVVMIGDRNADSREAIEHYGRVRVAEMPLLALDRIRDWQPPSWLMEYLA